MIGPESGLWSSVDLYLVNSGKYNSRVVPRPTKLLRFTHLTVLKGTEVVTLCGVFKERGFTLVKGHDLSLRDTDYLGFLRFLQYRKNNYLLFGVKFNSLDRTEFTGQSL